jgi:hypothetical protein
MRRVVMVAGAYLSLAIVANFGRVFADANLRVTPVDLLATPVAGFFAVFVE